MQQMDDALLHAALAESQAARYAAALHGKMQKALTVGVALGQGTAPHGGLVAGRLHVALKGAKRQPDQRVEPVQAGHGVEQRFGQRVAAADVGLLVQQHGPAGGSLQIVGQVDARAQNT